MSNEEAVQILKDRGAKLEKKENSHNETKSGWWMDDVWLAPANQPKQALRELDGAG
jgi:hypothetical protein